MFSRVVRYVSSAVSRSASLPAGPAVCVVRSPNSEDVRSSVFSATAHTAAPIEVRIRAKTVLEEVLPWKSGRCGMMTSGRKRRISAAIASLDAYTDTISRLQDRVGSEATCICDRAYTAGGTPRAISRRFRKSVT